MGTPSSIENSCSNAQPFEPSVRTPGLAISLKRLAGRAGIREIDNLAALLHAPSILADIMDLSSMDFLS
jgi:hypothetical protein